MVAEGAEDAAEAGEEAGGADAVGGGGGVGLGDDGVGDGGGDVGASGEDRLGGAGGVRSGGGGVAVRRDLRKRAPAKQPGVHTTPLTQRSRGFVFRAGYSERSAPAFSESLSHLGNPRRCVRTYTAREGGPY